MDEKGFKNVPAPNGLITNRTKQEKKIYKISFIRLCVLEMCLDTALHTLTYSTFYIENFDCT